MVLDALTAGLGWPVAAAIIAVSFASSFITAAFGIGGGAVMLAVLATLLPGAAILPVHGFVQLGSNTGRAAIMLRHLNVRVVGPFVIGAFVGISIGSTFVVQLTPSFIQIGVGSFILWTIILPPPKLMQKSALFVGVFSSILTMFFGGTGPFVATFVKSLQLNRMSFVATHSFLMTIQHLLKTIAFAILGFTFSDWLGLIALLVVFGFAGTVAGRHVLTRIDEKPFRIVLNSILIILALRLIYAGSVHFFEG